MDKTTGQQFFCELQRLMRRYKVYNIEAVQERVVFFDRDGARMCGFESLDLSSEDLTDCLNDAGYRG
jgi:hypothetical protein